ncbi:MAG: type II toxin-antitoxin system ParD family antitoxin [Azospirillaceae bacterium]|nr:type II toxin-antitoxin system ParD family antitoxin [Azospirillaceae bacterium]
MPAMTVRLPNELIEFVEGEIASGDYATASEVVTDALRLLRRERAVRQEKLAILRKEIAIGWEEAKAGLRSGRSVLEIDAELDRDG